MEVPIAKGFGKLFLVEGTALVDGDPVASAQLTLAVGPVNDKHEGKREQ